MQLLLKKENAFKNRYLWEIELGREPNKSEGRDSLRRRSHRTLGLQDDGVRARVHEAASVHAGQERGWHCRADAACSVLLNTVFMCQLLGTLFFFFYFY